MVVAMTKTFHYVLSFPHGLLAVRLRPNFMCGHHKETNSHDIVSGGKDKHKI